MDEKAFGFSGALVALKQGRLLSRWVWCRKDIDMYIRLVKDTDYDVNHAILPDSRIVLPWIGMKTADAKFVPWTPSQVDILSEDWFIIELQTDIDEELL